MRFPFRAKALIAGVAIAALALPALAQQSILPPGFGNDATPLPPPEPPQAPTRPDPLRPATPGTPGTTAPVAAPRPDAGADELVETTDAALPDLPPPPPLIELPAASRRDPAIVGAIDPVAFGFGAAPWGTADGRFLSRLMRLENTPMPSRWLHIALRNVLLSRSPAPVHVDPVDWAAERAWLLLRMGEADAARMIVAAIDVADFTPKMTQVAVQSALASADPAALCPLRDAMAQVEPRIGALSQAMCAALSGEGASASAQIDQARRRGRVGGIDLVLADKVVGAGADTGRAATVEWEPVDGLTSWRFGLAAATGLLPPDRLMNAASPQLRAWAARAPMLTAAQRLPSARWATGLGVFSSAALVDVYATIFDATDPSELAGTDALKLRNAFVGRDPKARIDAMRDLWTKDSKNPVLREGNRAMLALAATRIAPDATLGDDAVELIAAMLAGGFDREAARWAAAVRQMDDAPGDRAWAMLALGSDSAAVDVSAGRIDSFIKRDSSPGKQRSRLLVGALAGTGRIDQAAATRLSDRNDLGLDHASVWTRAVDGAGQRGQAGSAVLLAAIGLQSAHANDLPAANIAHALGAMRAAGLEYQARMIAAELLART